MTERSAVFVESSPKSKPKQYFSLYFGLNRFPLSGVNLICPDCPCHVTIARGEDDDVSRVLLSFLRCLLSPSCGGLRWLKDVSGIPRLFNDNSKPREVAQTRAPLIQGI